MQPEVNIYELVDPRTNLPRYIGRTVGSITKRLSNHISEANLTKRINHRINWIKELISLDLKPIVNLIAIVHIDEWKLYEQFYIALYKELGFNLVNGSIGGDGFSPGEVPWNKGKKGISEETRLKLSTSRKLRITSQSTKDKMSETKKGIVPAYMKDGTVPENIKQKISSTLQGNIPWNKNVTGYSTKKKGYVTSQEIKDKIRLTKLGQPSNKKRMVKQYDINMNLLNTFESITEAYRQTKIPGIGNALTRKSKKAGGYIWL